MLNLGLVGVGYLGTRHLKHLKTLENTLVSGIWDIDGCKLSEVEKEFGVHRADSFDDLLKRSDAIVCVSTTSSHYEIGMKTLRAGKALFLEKPICATYAEGKELVDFANNKSMILQVGHIERFNKATRAFNQLSLQPKFVESHRLANWNPRGGDVSVVFDLMIHDLDLILSFMKQKPVHVHANGVGVVSKSVDIANARIEFDNGAVANVTASRISLKKMRKMRLFSENNYVALDFDKGTCEHVGVTPALGKIAEEEFLGAIGKDELQKFIFRRFATADEADSLRMELSDFRDSILSNRQPKVTGDDALAALKLAEEINSIIMKDVVKL